MERRNLYASNSNLSLNSSVSTTDSIMSNGSQRQERRRGRRRRAGRRRSSSSSSSTIKKQVQFNQLEIIELPFSLGDNPSVSEGAPISVSWEAQKRTTFNVDFFEKYRPERRDRNGLLLSADARQSILLQHGYCMEEIDSASVEASSRLQT